MTEPLIIDVKMVAQVVTRIATAKSVRTVKDAMTITELRMLADAALAGIKTVTATAKPNGLTDEGRVIAMLEADVARAHLDVHEAQAKVTELEEKIAALMAER